MTISFTDWQKHRLKLAVHYVFDRLGLQFRCTSSIDSKRGGSRKVRVFNVEFSRKPPVFNMIGDQREQPTPFDELLFCLEEKQTVLANVAATKCRQCWWYNLYDVSPLVLAVRELARVNFEHANTILSTYYDIVQPKTAAERVGICIEQHPLTQFGPLGAPMPWESLPPVKMEKARKINLMRENERDGLGSICDATLFGPVRYEKVVSELRRLHALMSAIQQNGYQRHDGPDGDPGGFLLYDDRLEKREWCFRLDKVGNHRAAVLAGTNNEVIPVRIEIQNVIRRSEVAKWPQVTSQLYSIEEALSVFDRIISASPPPACYWDLTFVSDTTSSM